MSVRATLSPLFTWRSSIAESDLSPTARHLALALSLYMNERGGSAFPGSSRLARDTGLSLRTVKTALGELGDGGYLRVVRKGGSPLGRARTASEYAAAFPVTGAAVALVQTGAGDAPVQLTTTTGAAVAPQDVMKATKTRAPAGPAAAVSFEADFSEVLDIYPNKLDKGAGERAYNARRKGGELHENLLTAAKHYAESVAGTDPQYILRAKNFFGRQKLYLDYVSAIPAGSASNNAPAVVVNPWQGAVNPTPTW
jgi:hypothetical protein